MIGAPCALGSNIHSDQEQMTSCEIETFSKPRSAAHHVRASTTRIENHRSSHTSLEYREGSPGACNPFTDTQRSLRIYVHTNITAIIALRTYRVGPWIYLASPSAHFPTTCSLNHHSRALPTGHWSAHAREPTSADVTTPTARCRRNQKQ